MVEVSIPPHARPFAHGHTGAIVAFEDDTHGPLVAKLAGDEALARDRDVLVVEARALRSLAQHAPVPRVVSASETALVMERVDGAPGISTPAAARSLAQVLAKLHAATSPRTRRFGFDEDSRIGGLVQTNTWSTSWCAFFARHRLRAMASAARAHGSLPQQTFARIDALASRIERGDVVDEPAAASLVHGDLWSGNVLCREGRVVALIDPAPSYSDAEIDLALLDVFGVDDAFWSDYFALRPPRPRRERRALAYRLWPLLVHVRLFDARGGGSYVRDVERVLDALAA